MPQQGEMVKYIYIYIYKLYLYETLNLIDD